MKTFALVLVALFALSAMGASPHAAHAAGSITLDQSDPHLGDTVTFTSDTDHHNHARIQLVCYGADLDGNGFADLIYGADQSYDTGFLLGSVGSDWLDRGGPADCVATLYQNQGHYTALASLSFTAGG